jgi:hypothetical protein
MVVKLAITVPFGAPVRENCSIRTELNDSGASLIDNIDRIIRANGDPSWTVESRIGAFPLIDERAVGGWKRLLRRFCQSGPQLGRSALLVVRNLCP